MDFCLHKPDMMRIFHHSANFVITFVKFNTGHRISYTPDLIIALRAVVILHSVPNNAKLTKFYLQVK